MSKILFQGVVQNVGMSCRTHSNYINKDDNKQFKMAIIIILKIMKIKKY